MELQEIPVQFTEESFKQILPKKLRVVTSSDVEAVNSLLSRTESITRDSLLSNITTYSEVLKEFPKTSFKQYLNAVTFLTNVNLGKNDTEAYKATFPDRVVTLVKEGRAGDIGKYAHEYKTTKLVTRLIALTAVPAHIMFHTGRHRALRELLNTGMNEAERTRDRTDALKVFLEHTKAPEEVNQNKVNINFNGNDVVARMLGALNDTAQAHLQRLQQGDTNLLQLGKETIDIVKEPEEVEVERED